MGHRGLLRSSYQPGRYQRQNVFGASLMNDCNVVFMLNVLWLFCYILYYIILVVDLTFSRYDRYLQCTRIIIINRFFRLRRN